MDLYPRYIEPTLKAALADTPVVCALGPRQAGKTTLVQRLAPKRIYLSFDDPNLLNAASNDPLVFVQGLPSEVILDEIQRVPALLPVIKLSVNQQLTPGRFILTGSANLLNVSNVSNELGLDRETTDKYITILEAPCSQWLYSQSNVSKTRELVSAYCLGRGRKGLGRGLNQSAYTDFENISLT